MVLTAVGVSAHASEPFKAVNAIHRLASFLADSCLLNGQEAGPWPISNQSFGYYYGESFGIQYEDDASGKTTLITGMVRTEEGKLRVNVDIRYSVTDKKERVLPILAASVEQAGLALCSARGYGLPLHS